MCEPQWVRVLQDVQLWAGAAKRPSLGCAKGEARATRAPLRPARARGGRTRPSTDGALVAAMTWPAGR